MAAHTRFLVLALALTMAAPAVSGCDKQRTESIKLLNQGVRSVQRGATDAAYSHFVRATKLWPENHRAHYEMGLINVYDRSDVQSGLINFETAEKLAPDDRDVLFHLGRIFVTRGETERGLRYLQRASKQDANHGPTWHFRGVGQVQAGKFEQADKAFRESIAIDPKYTPSYVELGEMYERFEHPTVAEAVYREGLRHVEAAPDLLNALGILKMRANKPEEAVELFEKAVTVGGGRTDAIFNLAFAFVALNDARQAYRYLGEYVNNANSAEDAENIRVALLVRDAMLRELEKQRADKLREEQAKRDGAK